MSADFDLDEINEIFFEESFEGLDVMESGLLNLEMGEAESEIINDIFRAAHSIKGGAGTFGFMEISEFTHVVETLLDEMRAGNREVTEDDVQLLLKSVDYLRDTMTALQNKQEVDHDSGDELQKKITTSLESGPSSSASVETASKEEVDANQIDNKIWKIKFEPHFNMLQSGNDPLRIFRELESYGKIKVKVIDDTLPLFEKLNPENCYLGWEIILEGDVVKDQILEAFDWVLDECDLEINELEDDSVSEKQTKEDKSTDVKKEDEPKSGVETKDTADKQKTKTKSSKPKAVPAAKESSSIRVSIEKVDALLDLVGELVITQSMLKRFGNEYEPDSIKDLGDDFLAGDSLNASDFQ